MEIYVEAWPYNDSAQDFKRLADQPYALFFDSNRDGAPRNDYSYICWAPIETIESNGDISTITNSEHQLKISGNPFDILKERLSHYDMPTAKNACDLPPFLGGAAGMFGYDLGRTMETIPDIAKTDPSMPDMMIGIYTNVIAYDRAQEKAWLIIHAENKAKKDKYLRWLTALPDKDHTFTPFQPEWITDVNDRAYKGDIARVIKYIYEGDIFQANLSRRLDAKTPNDFSAYAHYMYLRDINPAPFSAFMNFGTIKLSSCSPEEFLRIKDDHVETRPIKGTISDDRPAKELENSEKDRAENAMIVDLLRNDLSKVCTANSVNVGDFCKIETYEGLHHLVSTVHGKLMKNVCAVDALKACFPGGSITGAPKIRAQEIIEEFEPNRRGAYCGSLGMIGFNGNMQTSITIRTLIYNHGRVYLQSGGGIVADSKPQTELDETFVKIDALLDSFEDNEDVIGHYSDAKTL